MPVPSTHKSHETLLLHVKFTQRKPTGDIRLQVVLYRVGQKNLYSFNYHIDVKLTVQDKMKLEFGPMLNVMAALPNIDGALCSTPLSLADAQYWSAVQ